MNEKTKYCNNNRKNRQGFIREVQQKKKKMNKSVKSAWIVIAIADVVMFSIEIQERSTCISIYTRAQICTHIFNRL